MFNESDRFIFDYQLPVACLNDVHPCVGLPVERLAGRLVLFAFKAIIDLFTS
jgi:hypothetical protein